MARNMFFNWIRAALVSACALSANAQGVDKSLAAFTACNADFFKAITSESDAWRKYTVIDGSGDISWIKTANRKAAGGNVHTLPTSPVVAGLTVTHYLDESSDLGSSGLYYYWGFKVSGTIDSVLEKLKPIVVNNTRLREDGDVYVRTEIKFAGRPWLPIQTNSGSVPRPFTTERAFLIEKDPDIPNTVKILCSLQGDISSEMLQELRPDIDPKDFPAKLNPKLFDQTEVSEQAVQAIKTAAASSPKWRPKFKRISYNNGNSIEIINRGDGLLTINEDYSFFSVKRLSSGGLLQLKGRMGSNRSVSVTDTLSVSLPEKFENGETLKFEQESRNHPAEPGEKPYFTSLTCTVGDSFDASKIFSTLTGRAIALNCLRDNKNAEDKAFLEDLGIVVGFKPARFLGRSTPRYTKFDVEQ